MRDELPRGVIRGKALLFDVSVAGEGELIEMGLIQGGFNQGNTVFC